MKVLHCFIKYLPVTENWAYQLISNLKGVEVIITSKSFLKTNFYNTKFKYIEFPIGVLQYDKKKEKVLVKFLFKLLNFLILKLRKLYPLYLFSLAKEVNIVHSHFAPVAWKYNGIAKKLGVPHVISFYGYDYEKLPFVESTWEHKYRQLFNEAAAFICEGSHGARILINKGCPPHKVKVVSLGVQIEKIKYYSRNKYSNSLKLLQIASFNEKKGHVYTVMAFIKALEKCKNMHLTLVGGTISSVIGADLFDLIRKHNAEEFITIIDKIDFQYLYEYMSNFDVFIHPSCYASDMDCEGGAPVVLLDAQATGMPIISTTHCDIPDEVIHDETGFLAPGKDVNLLSTYIDRFYHMDSGEFNSYSLRARKHVENNYDIKNNALALSEIYYTIVNVNGK